MSTAALDALVNQFSDPLSFYRELIQNSIDAGSTEIEIRLKHHDGVMLIHVDDFGEGMTREIIDSRLTRLFSSRKDGDLTKIGKFGIGFVSVFAIKPDAVSIDTARDGESWRVLFHADRSFDRIARDEPVEGTKITIIKAASAEEFEETCKRTREVIDFWCKYVDVEVRVQGETVSRPFTLDSPCQLHYREEGTEIVVGYPRDMQPIFGFYNRGLTLLEGPADRFQRASMLINSRYLEHTLARDDVRQDASYFKVLRIAERLVRRDLPRRLAELLGQVCRAGNDSPDSELLLRHLARLVEPEQQWSWQATDLSHGGGHRQDDCWVAIPGQDRLDKAAHLIYGPYTRQIPAGRYRAHWLLGAADAAADPGTPVAVLDVNDAKRDKILASKKITLGDLDSPDHLQWFHLDFSAADEAKLELRTLWQGKTPIRQAEIRITGGTGIDLRSSGLADLPLFAGPKGTPLTLATVASAARRGRLVTAGAPSPLVPKQARRVGEMREDLDALVLTESGGAPEGASSISGSAQSARDCASRRQDPLALGLVLGLEEEGLVAVIVEPGAGRWQVLRALAGEPPPAADRRYCRPQLIPETEVTGGPWPALRDELLRLLLDLGAKVAGVVPGRFDTPGSGIADWVAVAQRSPGAVSPIAEVRSLGRGLLSARRTLVVNLAYAGVQRLLGIAAAEPELAAYLLVKLFNLRGSLQLQRDAELALRSWERRCTRSSA